MCAKYCEYVAVVTFSHNLLNHAVTIAVFNEAVFDKKGFFYILFTPSKKATHITSRIAAAILLGGVTLPVRDISSIQA
jgi:hypothetical protein